MIPIVFELICSSLYPSMDDKISWVCCPKSGAGLVPISGASDSMTGPQALNELVGLSDSSFINRFETPSWLPKRTAETSGVHPSFNVMIFSGNSTGIISRYRHIDVWRRIKSSFLKIDFAFSVSYLENMEFPQSRQKFINLSLEKILLQPVHFKCEKTEWLVLGILYQEFH